MAAPPKKVTLQNVNQYLNKVVAQKKAGENAKKLKQAQNKTRVNQAYEEYLQRHYASGAQYEPILSKQNFRGQITGNSTWHPENYGYLMGSRHHSLAPVTESNIESNSESNEEISSSPMMRASEEILKSLAKGKRALGKGVVDVIDKYKLNKSNNENNTNEIDMNESAIGKKLSDFIETYKLNENNTNEIDANEFMKNDFFLIANKGLRKMLKGAKNYLTRRYTKKGNRYFTREDILKKFIKEYGYNPTLSYTTSPSESLSLPVAAPLNVSRMPWVNTGTTNPWGVNWQKVSTEKPPKSSYTSNSRWELPSLPVPAPLNVTQMPWVNTGTTNPWGATEPPLRGSLKKGFLKGGYSRKRKSNPKYKTRKFMLKK